MLTDEKKRFLHDISHAAALGTLLPTFGFGLQGSSYSLLNNTSDLGKILVLIRLNGGNDGLNTVIP